MVSRTGILSDDYFYKNCIEYMPMPMGFMNAKYRGNFGNPEFPGIKTPKYFQPVSRPVAMDVYASTLAKFMKGNKSDNTRTILNELHRQAKDFIPPEVSLTRLARDKLDETKNNVIVRPVYFSGSSSGSLLTEESIASQSIPIKKQEEYVAIFKKANREEKINMMNKFVKVLESAKINYKNEGISSQVLKGKRIKGSGADMNIRLKMINDGFRLLKSKGANVDLDRVFSNINIDESDLSSQITKLETLGDDEEYIDEDYDSGSESPEFSFGKQD